jgi:hypothetical protein
MRIDDLMLYKNPDKRQEYATIEDCYTVENGCIVLKGTCTDTIFMPNA